MTLRVLSGHPRLCSRHGRARPGHPRLSCWNAVKTSWPGLARPSTSCLVAERRGCPRQARAWRI